MAATVRRDDVEGAVCDQSVDEIPPCGFTWAQLIIGKWLVDTPAGPTR